MGSLFDRPDPRTRPRDPAGTQPKVDPASLHLSDDELSRVEADDALEGAIERFEDRDRDDSGPSALPEETAHTPRFQFLLGALLAIGVIAVAGIVAVIVADSRSGGDDRPWSAWKPSGSDPLQAIADHVAPEYRLPNGDQLVAAIGGPLSIQSFPTKLVAPPNGTSADIELVDGDTAMFTLCGTAGDVACALKGKPSESRGLLLQREALELALYAFHYLKSLDQVVVLLPPTPSSSNPNRAMLFRRNQLKAQITRPLRETLAPKTPSIDSVTRAPDALTVGVLTRPTLYRRSISQAQDTTVLLMLEALRPETKATPAATAAAAAKQAAAKRRAAAKRKKSSG